MKILYVSENYPPYVEGGAEVSTSILAEWLAGAHEVSVATSNFQPAPWVRNGVTVYPILRKAAPPGKNILSAFAYAAGVLFLPAYLAYTLLRFTRKEQPQLINFVLTLYYYMPVVLTMKWFTRLPIFIDCRDYSLICPAQFRNNELADPTHTSHGYRCLRLAYQSKSPLLKLFSAPFALYESVMFNLYKSMLRHAVNHSNRITLVANSQYVHDQLALNGFNKDRLAVIYNISQNYAAHEGSSKATIPTFVYGGRLEKEKGIWDLINAAEELERRTTKPFSVQIAGTGSEYEALKEYVSNKKLASVTLLGHLPQDQVLELYAKATGIVATSRWPEPFGRFILEAISVGTPIISTAVGGTPEGIENEVSGMLFKPFDFDALATLMQRFIDDPMLSASMSANIRTQHKLYTADHIGDMRLKLYRGCIGK